MPRNYEDPNAKVEDLGAALDYLARRHDVDDSRLSALGICMGSDQVLVLAARDRRVHAVATVAAHFRDADADRTWLGSDDTIAQRLERGRRAQVKYERTGMVDYVPAVDEHRMDVGMPGKAVWAWYQPWDHFQYYDDHAVIDRTSRNIAQWFKQS